MKKKVVIALGGNALGGNLAEQRIAIKHTAKIIVDLVEEGLQVIISHGNGPQVGMLYNAMEEYHNAHPDADNVPMSVCVGMSQGYIGYDLQNVIREELKNRGLEIPVTSLITQVRVDENDPAFANPTKPIGAFLTEEEAKRRESADCHYVEDSGRGYRRVVASPTPIEIVELATVKTLVDAGEIVITCGGGGIPVAAKGNELLGVKAVIDKDLASGVLAKEIGADYLIILTAVEKVAINFGKENQEWLSDIQVDKAREYIKEGHFAPGSMLPKIEAAITFAESGEKRYTLITELDKAKEGILGKTGTRISM